MTTEETIAALEARIATLETELAKVRALALPGSIDECQHALEAIAARHPVLPPDRVALVRARLSELQAIRTGQGS